ncbi:HAD-IIB family hydrolase [Oscillatoria sp. CS-180]|uniref:HAD-IIB family hydrolase n=1 Tax=Oscillatoria sp. CS-180 TaxID=3021720 RepID=UPI00232B4040|nr:HAD-IIB family hydrolase [Oscillatoria sp. CS-180]MDB9524495.1 HAD-IIB family hydrolase [Oscillatoria sp. CS-180]
MAALILFTDLDGTLLHPQSYDYDAALPVIERMKQRGIPVIPVTSKTRAEVETLIQQIGLTDPFVVENGSAIYIPRDTCPYPLPEGDDDGPYRVVPLGVSYVMARAGLKAIAQDLGRPLKGFGDLSIEQVQQLTGLNPEAAHEAKMREFTEPFLTPKNTASETLVAAAQGMGFNVVVGDRFSHLIGAEAGKGIAVHTLVTLYEPILADGGPLVSIGLGNSPNDLDMLENVDRAIVLPGEAGPHPRLAERGWQIAPDLAPKGWAIAVTGVLDAIA